MCRWVASSVDLGSILMSPFVSLSPQLKISNVELVWVRLVTGTFGIDEVWSLVTNGGVAESD